MGYNQLVIDPNHVPCDTHEAFMSWLDNDFGNQQPVENPSECTDNIAAFYTEITDTMPDLNDPIFDEDEDEDDSDAAEYDLRPHSVYLECSGMPGADELAPTLARKHNLAYVEISGDSTIYLPDGTTVGPN
ncbi:hypothetical protein [Corynebacterium glaucum]|mgnify:FL=1|uniref:hypothetical protein n=1 Tax=Corynebacterium glaucum TaxID=187491 RepID=UPI00265845E0|nr:hypothetical protein [Corynebacterium glaucum]